MEEKNTSIAPQGERFRSRFGAIVSAIGFTVGIGALWGTPMYISKNGGGFAIIMIVGLSIVIAIPLAIIEFGLGRKTRKTILTGMESLVGKKSPFNIMGWVGASAGILLASSFIILNALVVYYFFYALTGKLNNQTVEAHQAIYDGLFYNGPMMFGMAIVIAAAYIWVNGQNVAKGLERVCKVMVPTLLIILIGMALWNIFQPGGLKGLIWFVTPDLSVVNTTMLGEALWTIFLLSPVGYSFAWAYGSYMPGEGSEGDVPVNSAVIVLADCCTGILVGLSIFPAMFAAGIDVSQLSGLSFYAGIPLTFDTIPGGEVLIVLFFLLAFFALFTTGSGLGEGPSATFKDYFGWSKRKAAVVVNLIELAIALITIVACSAGVVIRGLDPMSYIQYFTMLQFVPVGAMFLLVYMWKKWGFEQFKLDVNEGAAGFRVNNVWKIFYYFIVPIITLYAFYFGAQVLYLPM